MKIRATIAGFVRLCIERRNVEGITGAFEDVGFHIAVEPAGPKELYAIPRRLDADHAVLPLLPRS